MKKFICKNCNWTTDHFSRMQKHLIIKNKCLNLNKKDNALLDLDEKFVFSIIPHNEDGTQDLYDNKNIKNIHFHINELIDKIIFIYKNKIKVCPYCNTDYKNYTKLRNHIILTCFITSKDNNKNKNEININNINSTCTINNNTNNNTNNINIENINANINIEIKYPISFTEGDWTLEKIDDRIQKMLSINKFAYSNLLKEILKNNLNQNVYIDKDKMSEQGMVFINKQDKFIPMSMDNIINCSMAQLNKLLLYINTELQSEYKNNFEEREYNIDINNMIESNNYIKKKYDNYLKSNKIKDEIKLLFTEIFNNNNDVSKKLYEEFIMIIDNNNIHNIHNNVMNDKEEKLIIKTCDY
jgi:hypothetical protein